MEPPSATSDPIHHDNGREYFTYYEEMIACGLIFSGTKVYVIYPESIGPFIDLFVTVRALIWDNMVAIFYESDV